MEGTGDEVPDGVVARRIALLRRDTVGRGGKGGEGEDEEEKKRRGCSGRMNLNAKWDGRWRIKRQRTN
jgi:hypothetical protein